MRPTTTKAVEEYKDMLFRIAFNICRCEADADGAVQDCLIKYHTPNVEYENQEHMKTWLILATINPAKNITMSFWCRNRETGEDNMADMAFAERLGIRSEASLAEGESF